MNHIEIAIKDAQGAGWQYPELPYGPAMIREIVFLDPEFWKSLGNARGWNVIYGHHAEKCRNPYCNGKADECLADLEEWKWHWHCFIDYLVKGKDADSYFADL